MPLLDALTCKHEDENGSNHQRDAQLPPRHHGCTDEECGRREEGCVVEVSLGHSFCYVSISRLCHLDVLHSSAVTPLCLLSMEPQTFTQWLVETWPVFHLSQTERHKHFSFIHELMFSLSYLQYNSRSEQLLLFYSPISTPFSWRNVSMKRDLVSAYQSDQDSVWLLLFQSFFCPNVLQSHSLSRSPSLWMSFFIDGVALTQGFFL